MREPIVRAIKLAVPVGLIFVGLMLLTGCFFIPTFNVTAHGTDVAAKVGDAKSNRPIRVGFATRQQIEAMFGPAPYRDEAGRRIGYAWSVRNGVWFYPLCFQGFDQIGDRGIELDFDEHDVLYRFLIFSADPEGMVVPLSAMSTPDYPRRPPFDPGLHPNAEDLKNRRLPE